MHPDIKKIIVTEEEIETRIKELAGQISKNYENKDLLLIVILRGAVIFLADLSRHLTINAEIDFMAAIKSGYKEVQSNEVKIIKDLDKPIEGRDALIIEDIIDNGNTLDFIVKHLQHRNPKSLKVCTLLDKAGTRSVNINSDYNGFVIPDNFVVGYGLDYRQKYRNLPYIGILKDEVTGG